MNLQPVDAHMAAIEDEYRRACAKFPAIHSAHEGIAVIREEYLELEKAVFVYEREPLSCQQEATKLAAMCLRYLVDVVGARINEDDMPW